MTVAELIQELSGRDPESEVIGLDVFLMPNGDEIVVVCPKDEAA